MHLDRYRRAAVAFVAASSFSLASTATAVARPLEPPGLPAPTPLVLHVSPVAPGESSPVGEASPVAPGESSPVGEASPVAPGFQPGVGQAAMVPVDVPIRVPAQTKASLGKFVLVLLAIVGLALLAAVAIIAYAVWDIRTDNE